VFDPSIGRWLEEDPIGFEAGDPNLSRYVGNNPTNGRDPSGLADEKTFREKVGLNDEKAKMVDEKEYAGKSVKGKTPDGDAIEFTFDKAQKGSFPYRTEKGKTVLGTYVNISAKVDCDKYDEIRFVQVLILNDYKDGKIDKPNETLLSPVRKSRSGLGDSKALFPGWRVDAPATVHNPFFGYNDDRSPGFSMGKVGAKESNMQDCPGNFKEDLNVGHTIITTAIGYRKGKPHTYLGSVKWGFYTNDKGVVVFDPPKPELLEKAPPELGAAVFRWNKIGGNLALDKVIGVDFVGEKAT
jgi:hypothetical protein